MLGLNGFCGEMTNQTFFKICRFRHDVGDDEMSHVKGIERTEEETNFLRTYSCNGEDKKHSGFLFKIVV